MNRLQFLLMCFAPGLAAKVGLKPSDKVTAQFIAPKMKGCATSAAEFAKTIRPVSMWVGPELPNMDGRQENDVLFFMRTGSCPSLRHGRLYRAKMINGKLDWEPIPIMAEPLEVTVNVNDLYTPRMADLISARLRKNGFA